MLLYTIRKTQGNSIDCKICYSVDHDSNIQYLRMIENHDAGIEYEL